MLTSPVWATICVGQSTASRRHDDWLNDAGCMVMMMQWPAAPSWPGPVDGLSCRVWNSIAGLTCLLRSRLRCCVWLSMQVSWLDVSVDGGVGEW